MLQILLLILSGAGFLIALYFTLGTYRLIPGSGIPGLPICDVNGRQVRIVDTFFGRVFGLPNSLYGSVYYLLNGALAGIFWETTVLVSGGMAVLSGLVAAFSVFLFYALLYKLGTRCKLCITSHLLNLGIFFIWLWDFIIPHY